MKGIKINSEDQTTEQINIEGLKDMQGAVGGYIEVAHYFSNGDVLLVDEEGLMKGNETGFKIAGRQFVGNGLILSDAGEDFASAEMLPEDARLLTDFI